MKLITVEQAKENTKKANDREMHRHIKAMHIYEWFANTWYRIRLFFCKLSVNIKSKHSSVPYIVFIFNANMYSIENIEEYFYTAGYTVNELYVETPGLSNKWVIRISWGAAPEYMSIYEYPHPSRPARWGNYTPDKES